MDALACLLPPALRAAPRWSRGLIRRDATLQWPGEKIVLWRLMPFALALGCALACASPALATQWVLPPAAEPAIRAMVQDVQATQQVCGKLVGANLQAERVELLVELPPAPTPTEGKAAPGGGKPVPQLWSLRRLPQAPWYGLVGAPPCPPLVAAIGAGLTRHVTTDPWQAVAETPQSQLAGAHVASPRNRKAALAIAGGVLAGLVLLTLWGLGRRPLRPPTT
jgi:hypothetical protein